MKNFIYKSILPVSCIYLYSGYANAACTLNPNLNNKLANIPAAVYNVQYDDNTPRDLGSLSANFSSTSQWVASDSSSCATSYLTGSFINSWSPNANKVALSNISGIGISVTTAGIGAFNATWDKNNANYNILTTHWSITVKKLGSVTQGGTLRAGNVARLTATYRAPTNVTWTLTTLNMPTNAIRINVLSCSLKNNQSTYNIDMQDWYDTQFPNIGSTSTPVNIPITLTCAAGTNIKATVTSSKYEDTATGKLGLTGTNSATGVAIQLLDKNNNPIKLNTTNNLQNNVPAGDYMFNWKARYIKTADNITPGTANASATVNIRYE
ncbi:MULTISPECIES: fimbrial protein [Providencia]|uniref:fimbrial protein n=1 Tax=Providencia TaxID=586 RepID=UPI000D6F1413|nr:MULTISPECIES: fimbrial protein [Providencia]AWS49698.1 fimbrial protein [Providencia rettgeri]EMB5787281.1 fimbrial protein [Providencia rettgeri]MCG5290477.1 fimbrial protein [Providencia rettgeri]MCL0005118.1 fimbrial protein [Providencia rettgeri]MCL0017793.1 fimbrial protein [Providencia rettgeri]